MITSQSGLGWNPIHAIAKVAKTAVKAPVSIVKAVTVTPITATARAASQVAHGNIKAAFKTTVMAPVSSVKAVASATKDTILIPTVFAAELTKAATLLALRPVTSRIRTLENRRAAKIAWDKRKSKVVTPADRAEAKSWTKSKLNKELPHGPLLAFLAGSTATNLGAPPMSTELGIAPAVIAALVPVFIAVMNALLTRLSKSGEAPVSIGPNGQPILPPGMDPTQPDPNAEAAAAAEAAQGAPDGPPDAGGAPGGDAGGGGGGMSPHGGKPNNTMLVGGAAVGLVLLFLLFKPKSGGAPAKK